MRHRLLPVLGGSWHDFSGFARWLTTNSSELGVQCETRSNLVSLARTGLINRREHLEARKDDAEIQAVSRGGRPTHRGAEQVYETASSRDPQSIDVVLLYNCFDTDSELRYSEAQLENLVQWVESGGNVMALHSATVAARSEPRLRALLGGAFVDHPPYCEIQIRPTGAAHSTTRGIVPFVVSDELYRHELEPGIDVHLVASDGKGEHPVAWTRCVQTGRVSYLGLGHDVASWHHPAFSRLLRQSIAWLCATR